MPKRKKKAAPSIQDDWEKWTALVVNVVVGYANVYGPRIGRSLAAAASAFKREFKKRK